MFFKITCPHCNSPLRVTEPAFGKTVPCPGCNYPVQVPYPAPQSVQTSRGDVSQSSAGSAQREKTTRSSPAKTSSPTTTAGAFDFLKGIDSSYPAANLRATRTPRLSVADMFSGSEREYVFDLLPGEQHLEELIIHHQHLFVVTSGVTRVTLTTRRLLYTATRVFSPFYWILLVLFPPLIFYYVTRISRNRNVSLPLGNIDSVEKRYHPNWLLFILAVLVGIMLANLSASAIGALSNRMNQHVAFAEPSTLNVVVFGLALAVMGIVVLALLLATRAVGIEVRSVGVNGISIRYGPGDIGVSEQRFDAFLQKVHAQMEHMRDQVLQPNAQVT